MNSTCAKVVIPLAASLLAACSSVNVTTDYDHSASFSKYKTYALAPAAKDQTLSPGSETALRDSLRKNLAVRGIQEAGQQKADLDVVRHVFVQEKVSVRQYADYGYSHHGQWPYRYGTYGVWTGAPHTYTDVTQYHEGTLILDFVDAHTKKLVFRGTGDAVVGGPESNQRKIEDAVEKIVDQLPIGTKQ